MQNASVRAVRTALYTQFGTRYRAHGPDKIGDYGTVLRIRIYE